MPNMPRLRRDSSAISWGSVSLILLNLTIPLHSVPGQSMAEVREPATNPRVAPSRILNRHPHDERRNLAGCARTASTAAGTAVIFLRDQLPVPAKNRVRRHDSGHLRQHPSPELLSAHSESPPLGIGESQRSRPQLLQENTILFAEIVNQVFLVAVYPTGEREHEELERRRHRHRLPRKDHRLSAEFLHLTG